MRPTALKAVLAAAALAALGVVTPAHAETQITMIGTQFVPAYATLAVGDTVTWTNAELQNYPVVMGVHNVIPDPETAAPLGAKEFPTSSLLLMPGQTYSCTGTASGARCLKPDGKTYVTLEPGTYTYKCGLHPNQMRGVLSIG